LVEYEQDLDLNNTTDEKVPGIIYIKLDADGKINSAKQALYQPKFE
jgi:hypothetical protein